jgi:tubulin polyglutamylase TTLL4
MKPTASSCGRGIRVIGKKQNVPKRSGYLVSKYLSKPHLLRGYKYDMRIYIVVTCFEPLKAYIFKQGLVRLATQPYSTAKGPLKKRFIHLTNFSINKKAENYVKNTKPLGEGESTSTAPDSNDDNEMSSKWSLEQLRAEYQKQGISYDEVFKSIKVLCIKTLMAVEPQITTAMRATKHRNQCFEIYGFDVIID